MLLQIEGVGQVQIGGSSLPAVRVVPLIRVVALLVNPNVSDAEPTIRDAQEAARTKGLQLAILRASDLGNQFEPLGRSANFRSLSV